MRLHRRQNRYQVIGLSVGDLQIDLLRKIEELTLHVIELNKVNKELRKQMGKMQEEIGYLSGTTK